MVAAGAVDGRGGKIRQGRHHISHAHCIGKTIAGHRIEQAGRHAHARHAGRAFIQKCRDIAADGQRQDTGLLPDHAGDLPALHHRIIGDMPAQQIRRQIAAVGKIRVFDQDMARAVWQCVNKAIAVFLRHRGIHDDRAGQAMILGQLNLLAQEFLPAQIERL